MNYIINNCCIVDLFNTIAKITLSFSDNKIHLENLNFSKIVVIYTTVRDIVCKTIFLFHLPILDKSLIDDQISSRAIPISVNSIEWTLARGLRGDAGGNNVGEREMKLEMDGYEGRVARLLAQEMDNRRLRDIELSPAFIDLENRILNSASRLSTSFSYCIAMLLRRTKRK